MARPSARQRAMADFLDARLAVPLGMASMAAEYDAAGTMMAGSAIWANARDWAPLRRIPAPQRIGARARSWCRAGGSNS